MSICILVHTLVRNDNNIIIIIVCRKCDGLGSGRCVPVTWCHAGTAKNKSGGVFRYRDTRVAGYTRGRRETL